MDAFPNGGFVRLESRVLAGKFVHADEDWEKVSLRSNGAAPALNAVWRVEHRVSEGYTYVLLQNAAYGRYLSYSTKKAKFGHRGFRATQRNHSEPSAAFDPRRHRYPCMWTVQRSRNQAYVSLRYTTYYLCANRKFVLSAWTNSVTADLKSPMEPWVSTAMHWKVHPVAESLVPQPLPLVLEDDQGDDNAQMYPHPPRTIRHVQANDEGEFDQNHHNWDSFAFYESSVFFLKNELHQLQGWNQEVTAYTLCMRPGSHGRLMPLVTAHLPGSLDSVNIVVLRNGTTGAATLRYPAALADAAA